MLVQLLTDSNRRTEAFDSLEKQHKEQLELKSVLLVSPSFDTPEHCSSKFGDGIREDEVRRG